jgi:hypothetical protein
VTPDEIAEAVAGLASPAAAVNRARIPRDSRG